MEHIKKKKVNYKLPCSVSVTKSSDLTSYQSGFSTGLMSDLTLSFQEPKQAWARPTAVPVDKPIEFVQREE